MAIPTVPGSPAWYLWGDDVDGLGTNNASLTDGQLLTDWSNARGSAGGTATQGNAAIYRPTLLKAVQNGRAAVVFDQDVNYLALTGSASSLAFLHQTGVFDIVLVLRPDYCGDKYPLASTNTGAEKGFGLDFTATNTLNVFVSTGSTILNFTGTQVFTQGEWWIARIRGDGVHAFMSQDGGAEQQSSAFGSFTTGNMARDAWLGANPAGTPLNMGAAVAFLAIWSTPLDSGQWSTLLADLQAYYVI